MLMNPFHQFFSPQHSLRFRHRLLVHEGDTATADVAGHYDRWLE